jgi:hypothetical protein
MGGFARRLDHEAIERYVRGQKPFRAELNENAANAFLERCEYVHGNSLADFGGARNPGRRPSRFLLKKKAGTPAAPTAYHA